MNGSSMAAFTPFSAHLFLRMYFAYFKHTNKPMCQGHRFKCQEKHTMVRKPWTCIKASTKWINVFKKKRNCTERVTDCELFAEVKRIQMLVLKTEYGVTVKNSMFDISLVFTLPANHHNQPITIHPSFHRNTEEQQTDACMTLPYGHLENVCVCARVCTCLCTCVCVCARACMCVCVYTPSAQVSFVQNTPTEYYFCIKPP